MKKALLFENQFCGRRGIYPIVFYMKLSSIKIKHL